MMRRLVTLALVVPLSLNGLWMVCAAGSGPSAASEGASSAVDAAQCKKMCPLHAPEPETAQLGAASPDPTFPAGAICLLTSNGEGTSIAGIFFVVAPPPIAEAPVAAAFAQEVPCQPPTFYSGPDLAGFSPPPEA